jgi:hypothetical protein
MSRNEQSASDFTLPADDHGVYIRMAFDAQQVASHLERARKRPVRHNLSIERTALWHTLRLDQDCMRILDPTDRIHLLRPQSDDAKVRYEIEAAIRTIPEVLPFTTHERETLRASKSYNSLRREEVIAEQPALAAQWHKWLWTPQNIPSPLSEVLAEASSCLEGNLGRILVAHQASQGDQPPTA